MGKLIAFPVRRRFGNSKARLPRSKPIKAHLKNRSSQSLQTVQAANVFQRLAFENQRGFLMLESLARRILAQTVKCEGMSS